MSSLAHLFPGDETSRSGAETVTVTPQAAARLEGLFASPRTKSATPAPGRDDAEALQKLVGARGRAAGMGAGGPVDGPTRVRRAGNRVDVLNVVCAVLAIVAVVVATVVAWNAIASSTPEKDALRTLSQTEAVLANRTQAVNSAIERAEATRAEGITEAQQFAAPLADVVDATDEAARTAAETARAAYQTGLEAVVVPAGLEPFEPPTVDSGSLASIGAAIDAVAVRSDEVAAVADEVAAANDELGALGRTFTAAMATFAATVPGAAQLIVDENPDADESFREAVTATAAAVAASGLSDAAAAATLPAYASAVEALRDDQLRAEIAIAEQLAREEEERRRADEQGGGGTVEPTDPVVPPTDPVDPEGG